MKTLENDLMTTVEEWPASTVEERIRRLEDVRSISEVVAHYARCVDNGDGVGAASVFAEDGSLVCPGAPPICGRAKLAKLYGRLLVSITASTHAVSNLQVCVTGPDSAKAHCVLWAWDGYGKELDLAASADQFSFGRYELELVRETDGEWRVQAMNINFAGQTGENGRFAEHLNRPWPPQPAI